MTMYLGDFPTSGVVDFNWSSNNASGASITRATNGTVSVYKGNSTTQTTTGVTDTEDFDSLTGIHHCRIDTSADGTFYAAGSEFSVVLSGATIDGQSVNAVLAHFSIERSGSSLAYLKNATYGLSVMKTLVDDLETRLTATRAGYLDNLSGGAVALASALATVNGYVDELEGRLTATRAGYLDNLSGGAAATASAVSTLTAYVDTEVAAILAAVDTEVAAIKAKTDNLPASPAAVGSAMTLADGAITEAKFSSGGLNAIADAILKRDWSAVTGEASRSVLNALRFLRNKWTAVGATLTVTKEDDSTTAWAAVITKDAASDPITGSDPT